MAETTISSISKNDRSLVCKKHLSSGQNKFSYKPLKEKEFQETYNY